MSLKRRFVPVLLLIVLVSAVGVAVWYLPVYVERRVLPQFFQNAEMREYTVAVRRLGFSGLDLERITLGDAKEPWLSIDTIQVDYSLSGIIDREIKAIVVNGLQIEAVVQDGGIVFPGLVTTKHLEVSPVADESFELPVTIDSMSVRNASLAISHGGKRFYVPFSLQARKHADATSGRTSASYDCLLQLRPRGQEIRLAAQASLPDNRIDINLTTDSLLLDVFSDLLEANLPLSGRGTAAIRGNAAIKLRPLQLITGDAECKLFGARIKAGNVRLQGGTDNNQQEIPIRLRINCDHEKVTVAATGLMVDTPFPVHIPVAEGTVSYSATAVDLKGGFQLEMADEGLLPEALAKTESPVRINADYTGHYSPAAHDWRLTIPATENRPPSPAQVFSYRRPSLTVVYDKTQFSLNAQGSGNSGRVDYTLKLAGLSASSGTVAVKVPTLSLTGRTELGGAIGQETDLAGDFSGLHVTAGTTDLTGDVSVATVISSARKPAVTETTAAGLQGRVKLTDFTVREKGLEMQADAIQGEIPFQWPPSASNVRGEVILPAIRWQHKDLGPLTLTLQQQGKGFAFEGEHKNRLLKQFSLHLSGQAAYDAPDAYSASCVFNTTGTDLIETDLGVLSPALQGFLLRGGLQLDGEGSLDRGVVRARLNSRLQDATLRVAKRKLLIEGINGSLDFIDLLQLRSNPQQKLRFSRAAFGDFMFEDGDIDFQFESGKSLLIEKSSCKWAGGSIYSYALRIHPGVDNYDLTLFCDRLRLASLLEQFGAADAEGDGAVSGRLPLVYADGKVSIGDGFLYSTPGEGGTIRIAGADALAAGIPKNTPQFAQIDFAMEALKNFNYKWVKLQTKTEDENLVLTMQLDGMPDRTLPFRYDSSIGQFTRIDLRTEKGILQPIRLDVNFRLPLNSLLDYSKGIGKLIDRMK